MLQEEIASGFARVVTAINAIDTKISSSGVALSIETTDPGPSPTQNIWILETATPVQDCGGFFGAMPVIEESQDVSHYLSVRTNSGVKRLELS